MAQTIGARDGNAGHTVGRLISIAFSTRMDG
jgi:hypothetical protein